MTQIRENETNDNNANAGESVSNEIEMAEKNVPIPMTTTSGYDEDGFKPTANETVLNDDSQRSWVE